MPVFQQLINFNQLIQQLKEPPIFINDIANESEEDKESIKNLITTRYSSDMISLLPSCNCGHVKGEFSIGITCPECGTVVKSSIENDIEPIVWFRKPKGVSKLISPIVLMILKQRFKKSGFSVIQWLIDTTYRTNIKQPKVIDKIMQSGIQRGYNNFVDNFDIIMSILFNIKEFPRPKNQTDYLEKLIKEQRDAIFCDYIPLPNKSLLVIEKTNVGIYVDTIIVEAVDAIKMLVSIDNSFYDQSHRVKENRTAKALCKLTDFYEKFNKSIIAGKTGLLRKHSLGTRTNFSFRAVISSITDKHKYDEIYAPWGVGVTAFRYHLVNKLLKLGMDLNSSIGLLFSHVETYHPLIDQLLNELINETPDKGIYCIGQRNPSLLQGSAQRLKISKFKTDPKDHTVSISILIVKAFNADFDGDQMNFSIAVDKIMADRWYPLEPKFNIYQLNKPYQISSNISIPKPVIASISNWLEN